MTNTQNVFHTYAASKRARIECVLFERIKCLSSRATAVLPSFSHRPPTVRTHHELHGFVVHQVRRIRTTHHTWFALRDNAHYDTFNTQSDLPRRAIGPSYSAVSLAQTRPLDQTRHPLVCRARCFVREIGKDDVPKLATSHPTTRPAATPACLPMHVRETSPAKDNRLVHF